MGISILLQLPTAPETGAAEMVKNWPEGRITS
jgi:hypothetical protein